MSDSHIMNLQDYVNGIKNKKQTKKHWIVPCPLCISSGIYIGREIKSKLYITIDYKVGFCFRCQTKFYNEYDPIKEKTEVDFANINFDEKFEIITISAVPYLNAKDLNKEASDYLNQRNPYINWNRFNLKQKPNRIFIPFYYKTEIIYYQIRYINPPEDLKYFNPVIKHKPPFISPNWNPEYPTIIVEGSFDAMTMISLNLDCNIMAIIGGSITDYIYKFLLFLGFNSIILMLDDEEFCLREYNRLLDYKIKSKYFHFDGFDAEEIMRDKGYDYLYSKVKALILEETRKFYSLDRELFIKNQNTNYKDSNIVNKPLNIKY